MGHLHPARATKSEAQQCLDAMQGLPLREKEERKREGEGERGECSKRGGVR